MFKLRPFQEEALRALENPGHVICISPTGSGKSLIYERLSAQSGTRMLLVTPLIALARQQHKRLNVQGVPSELGTGQHQRKLSPPMGSTGAWIVSPEALTHPVVQRGLKKWKPNFLVVDECHCLWDWGEGFRPSFNLIPTILTKHKIKRSLWLTATLPQDAKEDLRARLGDPVIEIGNFALPEKLHLSVTRTPWPHRAQALVSFVISRPDAGIVFVPTREDTQRVSRLLSATGLSVIAYHAGMSTEERQNAEALIVAKKPKIIVATSAFGMGMDHPHLNWAILWQAPPSLLQLAQSIGRVGRRAASSDHALVLWDMEDFRLLEWTIQGSERRRVELMKVVEFLTSSLCRRQALERYFNSTITKNSGHCGSCDFCQATYC